MSKTVESLQESRKRHKTSLVQFGGQLPESILRHDKSDRAMDLMVDGRAYKSRSVSGDDIRVKSAYGFTSSGGMRRGENGTLSRFPQNVGRKLLLFYTKKGDTVYDPFAGHNSRMELCFQAERNYFGCDLSAQFMQVNREIRSRLLERAQSSLLGCHCWIKLHEGDSRKLPMKTASGDFTITSPPYWDIEHYGDEPEQLGTGKTYREFLEGLGQVAKENFRVLKPGAFCVWCINDFRKNGKFYSYHEHTARLLRQAGFIQWDIAITDLGSSIRGCFPNQVIESKILPKRHEYCLIFRKP